MKIEIFHIMPNDDKHESSIDCWCEPQLTYKDSENGGEVWTHRSIN
jgi:hypothetical protein